MNRSGKVTNVGWTRRREVRAQGRARVTIGVPVFNGAGHLEPCLESLIAQTYDDLEILISDNASTDRTPEICRAFCDRDERISYCRQPSNIGAAANYNFLARNAVGQLFKWAAHDDVCAPKMVERCVDALDLSPTDVLAFPKTAFIDGTGELLSGFDVPIMWTNRRSALGRLDEYFAVSGAAIGHLCTRQFGVVRREMLLRTGLIRSHPASDLVMLAELTLLGGFVEVEEYLFFSRIHQGSSIRANATAADLARWYDPDHRGHHPMSWTRVLAGYGSAVLRSSLPLPQKVAGMGLVARWFAFDENWRVIGGELKRRAIEIVRGEQTWAT